MRELRLQTVTRTQGSTAALKCGKVDVPGLDLVFEEEPILIAAFRRMVRELAYDVCEMALTTYLCAREHGVAFTGLPIFPARGLHHDKVLYNTTAGIGSPTDLEGRRVGVHRGYTVTTGVWARGILADEHGVDLDRITWVLSGDEHVAAYSPPPNVVLLGEGENVSELLATGELAAAVNLTMDHPDVAPLIPDAAEVALSAVAHRGFYPINHLIVVRDEVLEAHPEVAPLVFEAFATSKRRYVDRLARGEVDSPDETDHMYRRIMDTRGDDPLPYGIEPNRPMLETLMRYAVDQRIIDEQVPLESLFHPASRELTA